MINPVACQEVPVKCESKDCFRFKRCKLKQSDNECEFYALEPDPLMTDREGNQIYKNQLSRRKDKKVNKQDDDWVDWFMDGGK
jgi:hypothetical protein